MSATLTASIKASVNWTYTNSLTGSINSTNQNSFSYSKSFTNGTGAAGTADLIYAVQTTIAGGGNTTLDLAGSLTDFFGNTITMARVKVFFIKLTDDTTATSVAIGNATNPVVNWLSDGTTTLKLYNDGIFLLCDGGATAYAVTAATGDGLKIANNDGSNTATLQICLIGSTA